jgi:hypothetical protein
MWLGLLSLGVIGIFIGDWSIGAVPIGSWLVLHILVDRVWALTPFERIIILLGAHPQYLIGGLCWLRIGHPWHHFSGPAAQSVCDSTTPSRSMPDGKYGEAAGSPAPSFGS